MLNTDTSNHHSLKFLFIDLGGRGKEREKHWFIYPLIYAFIGWFFYVSWLGIEPANLGVSRWYSNQLSYSGRASLFSDSDFWLHSNEQSIII